MGIGRVLSEVEQLREALAARDRELAERDAELADQRRRLQERELENTALRESNEDLARKLALLRARVSGRKNERYDSDEHPNLPLLLNVPPPPAPPPKLARPDREAESADKPKRAGHGRRNLADRNDMKTRTIRCARDKAQACAKCGGDLRDIGETVSHRVEWVPGHFERIRIEREKCACPSCPGEGVLVAPEPSFALPRAMCGNGLLARVIVDKFADHVPLNRQAKRLEREGFEFSSNTLASWVCSGGELLGCVAEAVRAELLADTWLQGDDTGFPVQDGVEGTLRKGRIWALTNQQQVWYGFTGTKSGEGPAEILAGFGAKPLLVDGGSEFNLAERQEGAPRGGCWSHLRRYFFEAREERPIEAHLALIAIRDLFAVEKASWGLPADELLATRRRDARPLVDGFFEWTDAVEKNVRPKSALGEALTYARNQRERLRVFLDHPIPMHNNLSELMLRQPVVGRKNWLFARSEGGAVVAATMFTLVGSCMLQAIDPWNYLYDVLNRLPDHPASRVHELTPANWRLARS